jgi:GAF domain-containing protein
MVFLVLGVLTRYSALSLQDTPIRVVPSRDIANQTIQAFNILFLIFFLLLVFGGGTLRIGREMVANFQRMQRVAGLTPRFAAETSEDDLMSHTLLAVQEGLGYALGQLYLLDGNGRITRRARLGAGQQALISTAAANPGEISVIADAVQTRQAVQVTDDEGEPRSRHLVAPARRAISLPVIFSNGRLAAVLDVQTVSATAPRSGELAVLQALAAQFAAAWEKLALTNDQTRVINDQAAQLERLREQVNTLEGRARQTVVESWEGYLHGRGEDLIGFDLVRQQHGLSERDLRPASDLPPELRAALERGQPQITIEDEEQVIHVPIRIRNTMMGAMAFRVPAGQTVTTRQMETVRIVAERLGLALESTRLYEQYQAQARRERKASEVTGVLLGATDLNTLLNAAASAFNEALGAVSTRVMIEPAAVARPAAPTNGNGNGSAAYANGNQGGN